METRLKAPVSERAVLARVNRKLASDGRKVRKVRTATRLTGASYYLIDERRQFMADSNVNLEKLAKKLGVLEAWEALQLVAETRPIRLARKRLTA